MTTHIWHSHTLQLHTGRLHTGWLSTPDALPLHWCWQKKYREGYCLKNVPCGRISLYLNVRVTFLVIVIFYSTAIIFSTCIFYYKIGVRSAILYAELFQAELRFQMNLPPPEFLSELRWHQILYEIHYRIIGQLGLLKPLPMLPPLISSSHFIFSPDSSSFCSCLTF